MRQGPRAAVRGTRMALRGGGRSALERLHAFAQAVADGVRSQLDPEWQVQPAGAALRVARGQTRLVVDLEDLAARHPAGVDAAACAGVAACLRRWDTAAPDFARVAEQIVPCLWRSEAMPPLVPLLRRPWHDPLWVGYGIAEPECTLAVTLEQLPGWGTSARDLDRLALLNLQRDAQPPSRVVSGVLYTLGDGEHRERSAAQVLLPAVMELFARLCGARRFLVGLPHRGFAVVLRAQREDEPGDAARRRLDRARALTSRQYREAAYPLSDALFAWMDGIWAQPSRLGGLWTPA